MDKLIPINNLGDNTGKFLQQDRDRRFREAKAKEAAVVAEQQAKLQEIKRKQNRHDQFEKQWMSFYDGKALTIDMYFCWAFDKYFLLSLVDHNRPEYNNYQYHYVWSDPDYPGGDNTIRPFFGTYRDWCKVVGIPYGRSKGHHIVEKYCGPDVKFVPELFTKVTR